MQHRIFIAINIPEEIKKKLNFFRDKWLELPCCWTKKDNLHITLIFLGYLSDEELLEVLKISREIALQHSVFSLNFKKIIYGPPKKIPPRIVWVEGENSKELGKLQKNLEDSLLLSPVKGLKNKNQRYSPHITLGRIKQWEFRKIEPEERPEIDEDINFKFEVNSIEIMESQLKKGGAEYIVLDSISLTNFSKK